MSWIAAGIAIAAAAAKTTGALASGAAAQRAQREAAAAHDYNAAVAEQNADQAFKLADAQEAIQRRKARMALGGQAAQIAESGVTNTGSAVAVAKQSAANAELDSLLIQYHGEMQARGYEAMATSEKYAADVARANARSARSAMWLTAALPGLDLAGSRLNASATQPTTLSTSGGYFGGISAPSSVLSGA